MDDRPFNDSLSELRGSDFADTSVYKNVQTLEDDLFKGVTVKDRIINIEREMGRDTETKRPKAKICNRQLNFTKSEDREFLNELLNHPEKYFIVFRKDTWTSFGEYRWFIIYEEYETAQLPAKKENEENE